MFDKTGTLTVGKPVVVSTRILNHIVPAQFYELVAATEVSINMFLNKLLVSITLIMYMLLSRECPKCAF